MFKITAESHVDHGVPQSVVDWVQKTKISPGFFVATLELPEHFESLPCALRGPRVGDEPIAEADVSYVVRPGRVCASRLTALPPTTSRQVTVIAGPSGDEPCVLYTIYGGPCAPREPGDLGLAGMEAILESREFWSKHALAIEDPVAFLEKRLIALETEAQEAGERGIPNLDDLPIGELKAPGGPSHAFSLLGAYCRLREQAHFARLKGNIKQALLIEKDMQTNYDQLPEWARW